MSLEVRGKAHRREMMRVISIGMLFQAVGSPKERSRETRCKPLIPAVL